MPSHIGFRNAFWMAAYSQNATIREQATAEAKKRIGALVDPRLDFVDQVKAWDTDTELQLCISIERAFKLFPCSRPLPASYRSTEVWPRSAKL